MDQDSIKLKNTSTIETKEYHWTKEFYADIFIWDIFFPILFSWVIVLGWHLIKNICNKNKILKYTKAKEDSKVESDSFKSVSENLSLIHDYFKIETFDLEQPFIIPFPKSKREELKECDFISIYEDNKNIELKESLNNYIKTYYGECIRYNNSLYLINDFIDKIAEETSDNFISQIKDGKVRFNKQLFGVYDVRKKENKCDIFVYQSDYFTFKCTINIFNALKKINPILELPFLKKDVNISEIRPFLNSIGVGGFLIMDRGKGDEIVIALRGNNCDSGGYWHFSFDETFTTDDKKENFSFQECLKRALVEELGIMGEEQNLSLPDDQIVILDSGIIYTGENDNRFEFEICAYARICFSQHYTFEDFIKGYRFAKDAELETRCLDFLKIDQIGEFIKTHNLSPEAKSLLKKIEIINKYKVLGNDWDGFKYLQRNK